MKTIIIAEAGVNHNGDIELAKQMIAVAAQAGADFIKFQTFVPNKLTSRLAPKANYQQEATGSQESQIEMLKKMELTKKDHISLATACKRHSIQFLSTPFDLESVAFLESFSMPFWKIPSGEITNYPYLVKLAQTGRDILLSTGMCTMEDIGAAVTLLREHGSGTIRLLHCNTEYPTPFEDVNLRAMETLRQEFGLEVGYSDHTQGIEVPIAAVALGATIIEKHFTLDKTMPGPDHKASLSPEELAAMIHCIRNIECAMGSSVKKVSVSEEKNKAIARKSIVASCNISQGDIFSERNITTKRPGYGISPMRWLDVVGQRAKRDFSEDELIEL